MSYHRRQSSLLEDVVRMDTWRCVLRRIATDRTIHEEAFRVYLLLLSSAEGSMSPFTPASIARTLNSYESSVKRAIRTLVGRGYLKKRYQSGKLVGYEILENRSTQMNCDPLRPITMPVE